LKLDRVQRHSVFEPSGMMQEDARA
jgi:hypothetical protein